jgi:hypothetical protein
MRRIEFNADIREIPNDALLDGQGLAGSVLRAKSGALDDQAGQVDGVARSGVDRDGCATAAHGHASEAMRPDADRLGNVECTISGWVENVDLAIGRHHVMGVLEGAARQREGAGVGVQALRGDEDAGRALGLRRSRDQTECEQRCSESRECEREHWVALQ